MSPSDASPFVVAVTDLVAHPGEERLEQIRAVVDYRIELSRTSTDTPVTGAITLRGIQGGVMVEGPLAFEAVHRCYRCLTEWTERVAIEVRQLVESENGPNAGDADYVLDGPELDLEPIIRDEVALSFPEVPICRVDCAGLCPTCGADLNTGACPGHEEEAGSPFAELRYLLGSDE